MKHVSILIPTYAVLGSIEGARQLLETVNHLAADPVYNVSMVGLQKSTSLVNGTYVVNADTLIGEIQKTDLVIIPAIDGDLAVAVFENRPFLPWVKSQYKNGAEVAALCLGAFLLAETGLLNGRRATTHWIAENDFRVRYPEVILECDLVRVHDSGLYTSGGAYSLLNLVLHLIEKHAGRNIAIAVAKTFAIDIHRDRQLPFAKFQGNRQHDDALILRMQDYIESHYRDKITVDQLAADFNIARRNLERRFRRATANSVIAYLQRVRIEAAKQNFENSRRDTADVMQGVGYADEKAFRTTFKKITGLSPLDYRNRYSRP